LEEKAPGLRQAKNLLSRDLISRGRKKLMDKTKVPVLVRVAQLVNREKAVDKIDLLKMMVEVIE